MCAVALATNSGLSAVLDQQTAAGTIDITYGQGALASYFLFNIIFSFTYTPLQGAIPTEALETTTRAKGLALSAFIVNGMGFINLFAGPIALERIGYKYIFVFVAWDVVEAIAWYLFGYVVTFPAFHQLSCFVLFLLTIILQQCRVPGPHHRTARMGLQPAQPRQGFAHCRQGHPHRGRQGRREDCCLRAVPAMI
jgi:hypothetical protein